MIYYVLPHVLYTSTFVVKPIFFLPTSRVKLDMDEPSSRLIGAHGYCTPVCELITWLLYDRYCLVVWPRL